MVSLGWQQAAMDDDGESWRGRSRCYKVSSNVLVRESLVSSCRAVELVLALCHLSLVVARGSGGWRDSW